MPPTTPRTGQRTGTPPRCTPRPAGWPPGWAGGPTPRARPDPRPRPPSGASTWLPSGPPWPSGGGRRSPNGWAGVPAGRASYHPTTSATPRCLDATRHRSPASPRSCWYLGQETRAALLSVTTRSRRTGSGQGLPGVGLGLRGGPAAGGRPSDAPRRLRAAYARRVGSTEQPAMTGAPRPPQPDLRTIDGSPG